MERNQSPSNPTAEQSKPSAKRQTREPEASAKTKKETASKGAAQRRKSGQGPRRARKPEEQEPAQAEAQAQAPAQARAEAKAQAETQAKAPAQAETQRTIISCIPVNNLPVALLLNASRVGYGRAVGQNTANMAILPAPQDATSVTWKHGEKREVVAPLTEEDHPRLIFGVSPIEGFTSGVVQARVDDARCSAENPRCTHNGQSCQPLVENVIVPREIAVMFRLKWKLGSKRFSGVYSLTEEDDYRMKTMIRDAKGTGVEPSKIILECSGLEEWVPPKPA